MPCRYCLPHCLICGITSSAARCDGDSVSAATWYSSTTEAAYWSTLDMAESSLQIHRPFPKKVECLRSPTAHVSSVNQAHSFFPPPCGSRTLCLVGSAPASRWRPHRQRGLQTEG